MNFHNGYIRIPAGADLPATNPRARRIWIVVLTIAVIAATLALSCVTPFAALAVALAGTIGLGVSLRVVTMVWFANQVSGFLFFHFPLTANAFLWGIAIGVAALMTTMVAFVAMKYMALSAAPIRLGVALFVSFAVYETTLLGAAVFLGGFETFRPSIVAEIGWINAASLVGMIVLNEIAAACLKPSVGTIPRLAKAM
jgi:hypothetical protein